MADPPEVPLDDEARRLLLDQKKAEARKAIAAAVATSIPEGKTIADSVSLGESGGGSIASVEAGRSAKAAAKAIVEAIAKHADVTSVLIVEDRAVAQNDIALTEVESRLESYEQLFDEIEDAVPERPPREQPSADGSFTAAAALPVILGLAGLASTVVGLFRADYSVSSRTVTADKLGLIAEVAKGLREQKRVVVLPGLGLVKESPLLQRAQELVKRRYKLDARLGAYEGAKITPVTHRLDADRARLAQLQKASDQYHAEGKSAERKRTDELIASVIAEIQEREGDPTLSDGRASIAAARSVLGGFDAAVSALAMAPSAGGYAPLMAAALRELIKLAVGAGGRSAHVLYVDVSSAGADVVSRAGSVRGDAKAAFLGATGVTFLLGDSAGNLVDSGTFHRVSSSVFDFGSLRRADVRDWAAD